MRFLAFLPIGAAAFCGTRQGRSTTPWSLKADFRIMPEREVPREQKYKELLEWVKSKGGEVNDSLEIKESSRGGGYGAFTTSEIKEGDIIFTVPRNACMTMDKAIADPKCGDAFKNIVEKAGPGGNTVVMAGYIAQEYLKFLEDEKSGKDTSSFGPYFSTLPWERGVNSQEHVLFWTEEMVEEMLKESLCYEEAKSLKQEINFAIKVISGITGRSIRAYRGEDVEEDGFTWPWEAKTPVPEGPPEGLPEAVKGSFVCLLTRAFEDGEDEEKLVPILDLLQHSDLPNIRHAMRKDNGTVEVRARTDLKPGEELMNQYRSEDEESMPYARFFTRFGFVPGITDPVAALEDKSSIFFPQIAEV